MNEKQLDGVDKYYPLVIKACEQSWLVKVVDYADMEGFFAEDYSYFCSFSMTILKYCREYEHTISNTLALGDESFVIEVASNDGYLM